MSALTIGRGLARDLRVLLCWCVILCRSKYKGGASEMYVTYDRDQRTRGGSTATYPKVKRVYIAGDVRDWTVGRVRKKSGREVYGVRIEYEQSRVGYHRAGFSAKRDQTRYEVAPTRVEPASQRFFQVVELPEQARNVQFHTSAHDLPERYRHAVQDVR
jgi:hypothetical protein